MAGIQQAVNALTGSIGTVGGRIGIYNELVGKNKEMIKEISEKNEELAKKNEELENKNKIINIQDIKNMSQSQQIDALRTRLYSNLKARASRDKMLDIVYGEKPETTAGPNVKSNEGGK